MTRIAAPDDDDGGDTSPRSLLPSSAAADKRAPLPQWVTLEKHPVFSPNGGDAASPSPSPAPSSASAKRTSLQWVPLDKHPVFSSTHGRHSGSETPRDGRRSRNLLAWDAASSRLYAWDPLDRCVVRLSLRFHERDITSPSSSSAAVLEAAIPSEVLMPDTLIEYVVDHLCLNVDGSSLLLASSDNLRVMYIYKNTSVTDQRTCRVVSVASQIFSGQKNGLQILQASWHPYSGSHLGILSSDSVFRLFDLSSDIERPEQEFYLQPVDPGRFQKVASFCPVAFSFGGQHLWDRFSVFIVFSDSSVYVLCPIVPFGSICHRAHIEDIYEDINAFVLDSLDSKAVGNSHLAIAWLEATFPELANHSVQGGSISVSVAYPYSPIDASLSLQGPLTKVYLREENYKSEVSSNADCEGKVVGFLYRSIGKDSILVISWSSGQLQIDALADEVQPMWNVGTSPCLHVDSSGGIKGVAMICDSNSKESPTSKLSNISPADKANPGQPPPLLRLANVDLALPKNVLSSCPLSLFPDPLLNQRFYCLHGGGIDLIALQFLPFANLNPDKDMIGKPPAVYPVLNTCSSESGSAPPFGFVTIADLYGCSQIVSVSSSYEFIVVEMKVWNELLHVHLDDDKRLITAVEAPIPEIISKDSLTGPKIITIPSSTSLRTLAADSIEGRSTLHHYIKLFRENYVQYAHKVFIELKEHAGYLQTVLNDQNKRVREAKQSILNVEAKQAGMKNRIDRAFKVYELLDQRLENFRKLPAINKKPLSRAEREFKAELDRLADVELEAMHSAIQSLSARLKRLYQSSQASAQNAPRQTRRGRNTVSDNQLSQLKSSLEMLSILNKENSKKVKLIEHGLNTHEK